MSKSFYLIDGHAQIYRAFYAPFQELTSPAGEPTKATNVFCQMLVRLLRDKAPDYVGVALDTHDATVFRCRIDPNYKANRDPAPESLHAQADRIIQIVEAIGIPTFRLGGFEADDLIATIAARLADEDVVVHVVSRDKDLEQLISDRLVLYDVNKDDVLDAAGLLEKKGYTPEQAVEVQTLTGDPTDNVRGVHGIGPKKAAALIRKYGSAEAVVAHADELTPKMKHNVRAFADRLVATRRLVTLRRDAPIDFNLRQCRLDALRPDAALPIFRELGFNRLRELVENLRLGAPAVAAPAAVEPAGTRDDPAPPGIGPGPVEPDYRLINTPELFEVLIADLNRQSRFAFDTETTGLDAVAADLVGVSLSWQAGTAYYIPVMGTMAPVLPRERVIEGLRRTFENEHVAKVGHHLKYDLQILRQAGLVTRGPLFDTMIASFVLDPARRSHSLDGLSLSLLGHEKIPTRALIGKGRDQITFAEVDVRRTAEYACEDADYTWRLMTVLEPQLTGSSVEPLFRNVEMPLVEVLTEMESHGVAVDTDLLARLSEEMKTHAVELRRRICTAAGHDFNVDSTRQLAVVLFDELNLPVIRKTKTGRSTDAETLEALKRQTTHPIPDLVLQYRELAKLRNTYVDTLPRMVNRRTGRIHTSFSQTGASTGRLASSDPNLQNIPVRTPMGKRIRAAFVPGDPDRVLLIADYSQVELRVLAHYCGDAALIRAFEEGVDIHRFVAAQVHGVDLDDVTPDQRSAAKAVNFGIIYGQTPFGLSRALGIPVHEARTFIEAYFTRYPGIERFIEECVRNVERVGYAETILGRRRPIEGLHSRNPNQRTQARRLAVNTVIQGSAADMIKRAMIDIHRELHAGAYTARMIIQVHDELVFEASRASVEREAAMIREKMVGAIPLKVPVVVDIGWGENWLTGK